MYVVSNALLREADIVQKDLWSKGPLELAFIARAQSSQKRWGELQMHVHEWNSSYRWGRIRPGEAVDAVCKACPTLTKPGNPNIFLAPCLDGGYTQLHAMLASVVPTPILDRRSIKKRRADFSLVNWGYGGDGVPNAYYARAAEDCFTEHLWGILVKDRRRRVDLSPKSSLRLLADDIRLWMNRLYRVAVKRAELFPEVTDREEWSSLDVFRSKLVDACPGIDLEQFEVARPLKGGYLWWPEDENECEGVLSEMISGGGVMDSLDPVLDVLLSHQTHEDFSDHYSWIKDTFERDFYHRRAKLKVSLVETVDDAPCWDVQHPEGYGNVLFRDIMSFLDLRERHLVVALRHGKTVSEIAKERGLRSHAAISRQVAALKRRVSNELLLE